MRSISVEIITPGRISCGEEAEHEMSEERHSSSFLFQTSIVSSRVARQGARTEWERVGEENGIQGHIRDMLA